MKKIILAFFSLLIFVGCSSGKASASQPSQNPTAESVETIKDYRNITLSYSVNNSNLKNLLEDNFKFSPSTIDIKIVNEDKYIGFIYEYEIESLTLEDYNSNIGKDQFGNKYLYYGKLSKISDPDIHDFNVYQAKGTFIPSWKDFERKVSNDSDFYVILDKEKLSISFSENSWSTPLELDAYISINFSALFR